MHGWQNSNNLTVQIDSFSINNLKWSELNDKSDPDFGLSKRKEKKLVKIKYYSLKN